MAVVQDYAHVRRRRRGSRPDALARASWLVRICRLHEVGVEDPVLALTLLEERSWLHAQDAVYAATALNREIGAILTTDRDFEGISELERIDPLDDDRIDDLLLT